MYANRYRPVNSLFSHPPQPIFRPRPATNLPAASTLARNSIGPLRENFRLSDRS